METLKFRKDQLSEIEKFYTSKKHVDCCSEPKIKISDEVFGLPAISQTLPAPSMEMFVTVCLNCGKTEMFNLAIANISH
ncbi:hypothetical protein [Staphylococcus delphini]|uniref:hypothetical protein n=1 Tax=Staphylococcus delphini TaxID=53344 RepID=UPI001CCE7EE1|nr:hypothetical protein [Staphylococcus delphini]MBZ8174793.1 hypothetical protein [Staphylococcus delphini]